MDPSRRGLTQQRGPPRPVIFSLRGPDWEKLGELSRLFPERMEKSGKMSYITTDYKVGMPEVKILPNREKTLAHNVDIQTLGATVQALIGGVEIAKFTSEGRRYDVRVRLLRDQRLRPEDVGNLYVRNRDGELVKLSEVAEVVTRPSMQVINRTNRSRSVTVMANLTPGTAQGEALQEVEKLAKELLPPQYELVFTGSSKAARESIGLMLFAFAGGLIVAYMVLASQFNSYLHPFTILLALPFSISGALLALFAFGQTLNIFSILAIILLAGIVKKNSILLVDFTNHVRRQGKGCLEALKEACPIRLRPILMTSVATIAGALPGALALGPGGELRIPMCLAVVGGVFVSTLLTLLVVPCFYAAAEDVRALLFRSPASASASAAMEPAVSGK
jgi:HAE1 family hydrophobic/amphiphilic exporter-1